ncbi:MAG: hypothetical protein HRU09_04340 [Oligoflexales bacterium]|nr:hypothetical protein [Oligoflexales bacterium]
MLHKQNLFILIICLVFFSSSLSGQDFQLDSDPSFDNDPSLGSGTSVNPKPASGKTKKKSKIKDKKDDSDEEDAGDILYEVTLDSSIENSTIYKKHKKRLIFKTDSFTEKVRKYSIFLVLNQDKTGVIAELVVTRVRRKKKKAYARVTRIVDGLKTKDLVKNVVIRFHDLKKVLGNTRIFHENPIAGLSLERASFVMSSVNAITQSQLNPIAYSTGANLQLFIPYWESLEWANWFGLRLRFHQNSAESVNFRLPAETVTRDGVLGGSWSNVELLIQPWFRWDWIHHVTLGLGIMNNEDQLTVDEGEKLTYLTTYAPPTIRLGFVFNPAFNFFLGAEYTHLVSSAYQVKLNSEDHLKGKWGASTINTFGQILQPVSQSFKVDGKVSFTKRDDLIQTESANDGESLDQTVSDWGYTLSFGFVYSP